MKEKLHIPLFPPWNEAKKATFVDRLFMNECDKWKKKSYYKFVYQTIET